MKTYQNMTEQDANIRILDARTGCLVHASDTYIARLRAHLVRWIADLDEEIANRAAADKKIEEMENQ